MLRDWSEGSEMLGIRGRMLGLSWAEINLKGKDSWVLGERHRGWEETGRWKTVNRCRAGFWGLVPSQEQAQPAPLVGWGSSASVAGAESGPGSCSIWGTARLGVLEATVLYSTHSIAVLSHPSEIGRNVDEEESTPKSSPVRDCAARLRCSLGDPSCLHETKFGGSAVAGPGM